jgi:hypothetical protein
MRSGEIDGLKWRYVDFDRRLILVRETVVKGEPDTTKTYESACDIEVSQVVCDALRVQHAATGKLSEYVFCNRDGKPLDHNNFTTRVWYPLLRHLDLRLRRPYQTRHTTATLWLATGESPSSARPAALSSLQPLGGKSRHRLSVARRINPLLYCPARQCIGRGMFPNSRLWRLGIQPVPMAELLQRELASALMIAHAKINAHARYLAGRAMNARSAPSH